MFTPVRARRAIAILLAAISYLTISYLTVSVSQAQPVIMPTNEHPNPYRTINGFFDLPEAREWGATSAVDIDADGESIWVAERCSSNSCALSDADNIIKYDKDGNIVTAFGGGMLIWPQSA